MTREQADRLTPDQISTLDADGLKEWLRKRTPLYVDSVEWDGVSLSFVNPELIADGREQPPT